jgi:hypothetical protein
MDYIECIKNVETLLFIEHQKTEVKLLFMRARLL